MGVARILVLGKIFVGFGLVVVRGWGGGHLTSEVSKIFKKFLKKIEKRNYFSIFFRKFKTHAVIFRAFGKQKFLGNFEKILENFQKISDLIVSRIYCAELRVECSLRGNVRCTG